MNWPKFKFWFGLRVRPWLNPRYVWGHLRNTPWQPPSYSVSRELPPLNTIRCPEYGEEYAERSEALDKLRDEVLGKDV